MDMNNQHLIQYELVIPVSIEQDYGPHVHFLQLQAIDSNILVGLPHKFFV